MNSGTILFFLKNYFAVKKTILQILNIDSIWGILNFLRDLYDGVKKKDVRLSGFYWMGGTKCKCCGFLNLL